MTLGIIIVTGLLIITVLLLITEKIPVDLTSIGIMLVLAVSGVLGPAEAVSGFANPAVITVGAMFMVSRAMIRTDAVGFLSEKIITLARGRARLAMMIVLFIVAVSSAFINNTPVVVLFIPVVIGLCCRFEMSPSQYLIPLSYASILAGSCTLIGTSTNIIVSDLSAHYGYGTLGMFELARVGIPIAVIGLVFIFVAAPKLMPELLNPACELDDDRQRLYLSEISIPRGSGLAGLDPCHDLPRKYPGIEVLELIRHTHIFHPCRDKMEIAPDDLLLVKGPSNSLFNLINEKGVKTSTTGNGMSRAESDFATVVEFIIPPSSSLIGQKLFESNLIRDNELNIIAIERKGLHYTEARLRDIRLRTGDIMLILCETDKLEKLRGRNDWIIAEDIHDVIVHKRKSPVAATVFAAMVAAAATGLADIMTCALAAVFLMVISGALPLRDAYRSLQGDVLILIAGTIGLGIAMDKTGASEFYAELFLGILEGMPPEIILGGFILLTSVSTQILSNNATAVLLLPIAISTALELGVHPKPFIMAVVFGASACFATPIGYQTNLLVYGPGGYRFTDYLKLGMPLNLLVVICGTILVPIFWPF